MEHEDQFLKKMENLQVPDIGPQPHQPAVKMTIMNAGRSAALGVWLIIVPCYFLFCVCMYWFFHPHGNWFGSIFKLLAGLQHMPFADYMVPVLLVLLPIIAIVINLLAITHVQVVKAEPHQSQVGELNITVKFRLLNILLILISLAILITFMTYVSVENISIKN